MNSADPIGVRMVLQPAVEVVTQNPGKFCCLILLFFLALFFFCFVEIGFLGFLC